jgi:hypothetical protein
MTEHPERVNSHIAELALVQATKRGSAWTDYILVHYRATGNLAPGCDARDFYAWSEANAPARLAELTTPPRPRGPTRAARELDSLNQM